ncbi:MAG TPA: hypothetical protein PKK48_08980 [Phycisphaerae bacterium]|nr:hypothetical protein [Phycisphaerae bacterium]
MTENPFIEVLNELWKLLESRDDFTNLVKVGNRTKLTGTAVNPFKDSVQDSDLPEVQIIPGGGKTNLFATSTSHFVEQVYFIRAVTGELNALVLFRLKWALIKALANTSNNLGLDYVMDIDVTDCQDVIEIGDENRGRLGWRGMISVNVKMKFTKNLLT